VPLVDLVALRAGFIRLKRLEGRGDKTLVSYGLIIDRFVAYVGDQVLDRQLLRAWQDAQTGIKPASRQVRFSVVRGFLRFGAAEEALNPTLWLNVAKVRVPRSQPRPIPHEDVQRVLAYLAQQPELVERRKDSSPRDLERALRTRALFYFLFTTGARIFEALSVDRDDYVDGSALVIQKGGSEKLLITTSAARQAIAAYPTSRQDANPALFLSYRSNQPPQRLTSGGALAIWKALAGTMGIRSFGNHRIRHTTATELGEAEVLDSVVQTVMGHADPATTGRYREIGVGRRQRAVEAALGPMMAQPAPVREYRPPISRRRGGRRAS